METNLNLASTISGERLCSEEEIADYIAGMMVLEVVRGEIRFREEMSTVELMQEFVRDFAKQSKADNERIMQDAVTRILATIISKPDMEVVQMRNIWVTSVEQTVVDSIRDFEKIAGLEEVIRCMMLVPGLNEQKVLECLARNNNGFMYQKCGYLFEEMQEEFHFSANFFDACENGSSGAKRYLMKESQDNVFHKRWKLYAPASLKGLIDKGVDDYDAMG